MQFISYFRLNVLILFSTYLEAILEYGKTNVWVFPLLLLVVSSILIWGVVELDKKRSNKISHMFIYHIEVIWILYKNYSQLVNFFSEYRPRRTHFVWSCQKQRICVAFYFMKEYELKSTKRSALVCSWWTLTSACALVLFITVSRFVQNTCAWWYKCFLHFNPSKCVYNYFDSDTVLSLTLDNAVIAQTTLQTDLASIVQDKQNFDDHV